VKPVARSTRHSPEEQVLSRLVDRLPRVRQPGVDGYLALLDRELVERRISEAQADELVSLADEYGLDRAAVAELHHAYLRELARAARVDGETPGAERPALERMARLLGMDSDTIDAALAATSTAAPAPAG
jgi:DNA polymerase-3 subunit epsilon